MEASNFHELALLLALFIFGVTSFLGVKIFRNKMRVRTLIDHQGIETFWTVMPIFLLSILAVPSLSLLYKIEDFTKPNSRIKVVGHQWYWNYCYSNSLNEFSCYINNQGPRNLNCDNRVTITLGAHQMLVTGGDVIHSWAIPSLRCKVDAVPGRINQSLIYPRKVGPLYGQCSEICGSNHSFMPITLHINDL